MAQDKYFKTSQGEIGITMVADEAFATSCLAVKIATDGDAGVADAGTDNQIGLSDEKTYSSGDVITVYVQGIHFGRIASGSINAGVIVSAGTSGVVESATDGDFVIGKTIAQASGVNALVPILQIPGCPQIEDVA